MRLVVLAAVVLCACSGAPPQQQVAEPIASAKRAPRQLDASKYHVLVDRSPGGWVSRVDDGQDDAPPPIPPRSAVCILKGESAPFESCTPRKVPVAAGTFRGPALATFEPESVRMTWAVLEGERRGLWIDVRDREFILTGYVDATKESFLARRDVEVVADRAWILAGARLALAGGTSSGVSVRLVHEPGSIEGIDLEVPCDALTSDWLDVAIPTAEVPTVNPDMYAAPVGDVLRLYSARDGELFATLRAGEAPWDLAVEVHEQAAPWARVLVSTGSMRFEAWARQAELGPDDGGYGISGLGGCGRSGSFHSSHTRAAVASARVTVAAGPLEKGPDGLVILPGASVHVVASRDGFYKIEPASSTIRPPKGASFWVPHEALDAP